VTVGTVARDAERGEAARAEIASAAGGAQVRVFGGDLASPSDVRRLATDVSAAFPRLDLLVLCAAV